MSLLLTIQEKEHYYSEYSLMNEFPVNVMIVLNILSIVLFVIGIIYLYILVVKYLRLKIKQLQDKTKSDT